MRTRSLGLGNTEFMPRVFPRIEIEILTGATSSGSISIQFPTGTTSYTTFSTTVVDGNTPENIAVKLSNFTDVRFSLSSEGNKVVALYNKTIELLPTVNSSIGVQTNSFGVTSTRGLSCLKEIGRAESSDMYGYYGKYQGIATPNELIALAGIIEGTTKNDAYNNPNEDITWLKFSHNYKTLFVADRTIHYSISWNHLDSKGLVFGKVVDIDGQKYLLRLLQGANVNPASVGGKANSNDEWDSLIGQFTPNELYSDSNGYRVHCQETVSASIGNNIFRQTNDITVFSNNTKSNTFMQLGYLPVLEVL